MTKQTKFTSVWNTARSRKRDLSVILVVLALLLVGCGGSGDPVATTTPAPPTATPQPTPSLQLGQVQFAQSVDADGAPVAPSQEIPRSATTIIAVVNVVNVLPGTSFSAEWTMDGNVIPDLATETTLAEGASAGFVAFSLTWDGAALWPVGSLGVTITASSGEIATGVVRIIST